MNIVNKLTLRHLKENKGRTIVTTLGICVSVAMITAVFVALASFLNLFGEIELISSGSYQARISDVTQAQLAELKKDERISEIGIYEHNETSFQLSDRKNDRVGTGEICIGDETYIKQMLTVDYDGTIPKNENEIAIEQKLLDKNELDLKIGDKITLSEGNRYILEQGEEYQVYSNYCKGEYFKSNGEKEYTITAILYDNPATIYTPIIRGMSEEEKSGNVNIAISLAKINYKSLDVINEIIDKYDFESYNINKSYLEMYFAFDESDEFMTSMLAMTAVILVIIMIASVVLIYNAFAMSISERVRYLGMLASVGATRKQKRLSVYFESFILGIVGIPLGMLGGIVGIGITLKAIGKKIISTGMIMGVTDNNMQMKIVAPVWVIIGIILVSVLTIFVSSYIPSRKASKITPIDAIRQTNEVKVKAKKLRSSKLIRAIFGYEGELANKNLKRNGRKARVITASIALSVILFLCCNYFCSVFTQSVKTESDIPYQVVAMVDYDEKDKLTDKLDEMNDIDDYYCVNNTYAYIDGERADDFAIAKAENLSYSYRKLFEKKAIVYKNILDDDDFNELCKANGIDYKDYYGDEYKALLLNNVSKKSGGSKVFTDKVIGTKLDGLFAIEDDEMVVGALIDFDDNLTQCKLNPKNSISLYEPVSQYIKVHPDSSYLIGIETSKHSEVNEQILEFFASEDFSSSYYTNDMVESQQAMMTISFIIQVLVYGFIALISLITIFNIINTISTGVAMRKKEFAMLKSVGTTPKGFNKMIMLESAFYGLKALVFALPISIALSYGMYCAIHASAMIAFDISLPLYLSVIAVVLFVIGATMLYSVHKLKNDSIVETLKEEIN